MERTKMFERNVCGTDKNIRIILGVIFVTLGIFFVGSAMTKGIFFALAGVAFVTAFTGFCPLNKLIGINTCKRPIWVRKTAA
jgi:hypothetical protein